jgi:hypothetical protein
MSENSIDLLEQLADLDLNLVKQIIQKLNYTDLESISNIPSWTHILDALGGRYWKRLFECQFGYDEVAMSLSDSILDFSSYTAATKRVWLAIRKKSNCIHFSKLNENPSFTNVPQFINQDFDRRFLVTNVDEQLEIYDQLLHGTVKNEHIALESNNGDEKWPKRIGQESFKEKNILFNFYIQDGYKAWVRTCQSTNITAQWLTDGIRFVTFLFPKSL